MAARGRDVAVLVVAYGSPELLRQALSSVADFEVVVVDNSSDGDVEEVVRAAGGRYLDPGRNLGFGAGVNVGLADLADRVPDADVLVLNPDAVISAESVLALHDALLSEPRTAAVSPCLLDAQERSSRVTWPWPSPLGAFVEAVGLGSRQRDVWLVGAVLLLRREAVTAIGGFDERFFLYAEETDWQRRAAAAGWSLSVAPDITAVHIGAATSSDPRARELLFYAGQETYVRKWFGRGGWLLFRAASAVGAAARALLLPRARRFHSRRLVMYVRGPRTMATQAGLLPH